MPRRDYGGKPASEWEVRWSVFGYGVDMLEETKKRELCGVRGYVAKKILINLYKWLANV